MFELFNTTGQSLDYAETLRINFKPWWAPWKRSSEVKIVGKKNADGAIQWAYERC